MTDLGHAPTEAEKERFTAAGAASPSPRLGRAKGYLWSVLGVAVITGVGWAIRPYLDITNVALFYLLPVLVAAVRWGKGPSLLASFLGVLAFDFFFVPPVFSFSVSDVRYIFTFVIFLIVGVVTASMAARIRNELEKTRQEEKRTLALYSLSRQIAAKADLDEVLRAFAQTVAETVSGQVSIVMPGPEDEALRQVAAYPPDAALYGDKERAVVHWVLEHGKGAGRGTETLREATELVFPVRADKVTLAALVIKLESQRDVLSSDQEQLIEAFANLAAAAIIRVRLGQEAEKAQWLAESEKLHKALLDSISHDLRTPLSSITGAVTGLLAEKNAYDDATTKVLLDTIREGALRMDRFVANLLDMTRLQSGVLRLSREWWDVEDIVGVALREMRDTLQGHPLKVDIPAGLPLVNADFGLIEHVLINLLENAAKYSRPESPITISAHESNRSVVVIVADSSPPIPSSERQHIFDKFYRLRGPSDVGGTGLGLSICKGIVEAHGGMIWADSFPGSGNRFTFSLPVSDQPFQRREGGEEGRHG